MKVNLHTGLVLDISEDERIRMLAFAKHYLLDGAVSHPLPMEVQYYYTRMKLKGDGSIYLSIHRIASMFLLSLIPDA